MFLCNSTNFLEKLPLTWIGPENIPHPSFSRRNKSSCEIESQFLLQTKILFIRHYLSTQAKSFGEQLPTSQESAQELQFSLDDIWSLKMRRIQSLVTQALLNKRRPRYFLSVTTF